MCWVVLEAIQDLPRLICPTYSVAPAPFYSVSSVIMFYCFMGNNWSHQLEDTIKNSKPLGQGNVTPWRNTRHRVQKKKVISVGVVCLQMVFSILEGILNDPELFLVCVINRFQPAVIKKKKKKKSPTLLQSCASCFHSAAGEKAWCESWFEHEPRWYLLMELL